MTAKTYTEEELKLVLEQHQKWLREEEGGARANLTDANLTRADLTDANLYRADLTRADLTRANLTRADLTRANLTDANLYRADLTRANLTDANLTRASLDGANLADAGLDGIKEDFLKVLSAAPNEVDGLESALRESRVDGSTYTGECCCLVGTIANVCGRSYSQLPGIKPDASRPAERWFLAINPWLSAKHPIVKTTLDWVAEWKAANPPKILAELVER